MAQNELGKGAGLEGVVSSYYWIGQPEITEPGTFVGCHHVAGTKFTGELEGLPGEIVRNHKARRISEEPKSEGAALVAIMQLPDGKASVLVHDYWAQDKMPRWSAFSHLLFLDKKELWDRQLTPLDFLPLVYDVASTIVKHPSEAKLAYEKSAATFTNLQNALTDDLKKMDGQQKDVAAFVASQIDSKNPAVTLYFELEKGEVKPEQRNSMLRIANTALRLSDNGIYYAWCREYTTNTSPRKHCMDIYLQQGAQAFLEINMGKEQGEDKNALFYRLLMEDVTDIALPIPEFLKTAKVFLRVFEYDIENARAELEMMLGAFNRANAQIVKDAEEFRKLDKTPAEMRRLSDTWDSVLSEYKLKDLQQLSEYISKIETNRADLESKLKELQVKHDTLSIELASATQIAAAYGKVATDFGRSGSESLRKHISELELDVERLNAQTAAALKTYEQRADEFNELHKRMKELQAEHGRCSTEIARATQDIKIYDAITEEFGKKSPEELRAHIHGLKSDAERLVGQLDGASKTHDADFKSWNDSRRNSQQEIDALKGSEKELQQQISGLEEIRSKNDGWHAWWNKWAKEQGKDSLDQLLKSYVTEQQKLKEFEAVGAIAELRTLKQRLAEYELIGTPEELKNFKRILDECKALGTPDDIIAVYKYAQRWLNAVESAKRGTPLSIKTNEGTVPIDVAKVVRAESDVPAIVPGLHKPQV